MTVPPNSTLPSLPDETASEELPHFSPAKTIDQLMVEQGIAGPQDVDALFDGGPDLWDSEAEFEEFQTWLRESRREVR
jgi:hypothetical protein